MSFACAIDYDLCLRLSEITQTHQLKQPLYFYRTHAQSLSQQQQLEQIHCAKQAIARALKRRGLGDRYELELKVIQTQQGDRGQYKLRQKFQSRQKQLQRLGVSLLGALHLTTTLGTQMSGAQNINPATDGTNTRVTIDGNQFNIDGGQLSQDGRNLFQSFRDFNLDANQIANFLSTPNVQNILGRVNGGNPSVINGLIQVSGSNANLFLMNPSGIVFGANASLNVPGSFTATTANGIQFGDQWFSATGVNDYASLVGSPTGFAFTMSQPGAILNFGNLAVGQGQNLTLLGGTVVSTGQLSAPGGQLTVSAVPGESYVRISQPGGVLSLEVPISTNSTQPNNWNLPVASLPQLLTNPGVGHADTVQVNPDGRVQLTRSGLTVTNGDVVVQQATAQSATLSATNNLTLPESQLHTTQDLNLRAGNTVTARDSVTQPVQVQAGGNLTIQGNRGVDILALNHPGTFAFQSGGNLSLISNGVISGDAHFHSGGNFSIRNLTGGAGTFISLHDLIIRADKDVELGNYTGTSRKVEAGGNISGGDITITGPDTMGIPDTDPDYSTLTGDPALILRAGLTESASVIRVGNVTVPSGSVQMTTNGNIFTGDVDTSSSEQGKNGGSISLDAFNIFTSKLNTSSTAPSTYKETERHEIWEHRSIGCSSIVPGSCTDWKGNMLAPGYYYEDLGYEHVGTAVKGADTPGDQGGAISLVASGIIQTGDIDTHSASGAGGSVLIEAPNVTVGSINTQSTGALYRKIVNGMEGSPDAVRYEDNNSSGGDITINTTGDFQTPTILSQGIRSDGVVSVNVTPTPPEPTPNPTPAPNPTPTPNPSPNSNPTSNPTPAPNPNPVQANGSTSSVLDIVKLPAENFSPYIKPLPESLSKPETLIAASSTGSNILTIEEQLTKEEMLLERLHSIAPPPPYEQEPSEKLDVCYEAVQISQVCRQSTTLEALKLIAANTDESERLEIVQWAELQVQKAFHGHVRSWDQLTSEMQNALRRSGLVDRKGRILKQRR
jgi:filamentous hemagglutinin family protein